MQYQRNRGADGMGAYLRTSTELRRELARRGEIGIASFRQSARRRSGENARSVRYETQKNGGVNGDRMVGVVISYGPYAASREFGSFAFGPRGKGFVPGEHNLRNAIPAIERG